MAAAGMRRVDSATEGMRDDPNEVPFQSMNRVALLDWRGSDSAMTIPGTQTSPYVARNRDPILAVLRRVLPERGTVIEIASGTGEHAVHFATALPGLTWQPTERD